MDEVEVIWGESKRSIQVVNLFCASVSASCLRQANITRPPTHG